jgi:hypothetical protein
MLAIRCGRDALYALGLDDRLAWIQYSLILFVLEFQLDNMTLSAYKQMIGIKIRSFIGV